LAFEHENPSLRDNFVVHLGLATMLLGGQLYFGELSLQFLDPLVLNLQRLDQRRHAHGQEKTNQPEIGRPLGLLDGGAAHEQETTTAKTKIASSKKYRGFFIDVLLRVIHLSGSGPRIDTPSVGERQTNVAQSENVDETRTAIRKSCNCQNSHEKFLNASG
jgi:hypothetical protein